MKLMRTFAAAALSLAALAAPALAQEVGEEDIVVTGRRLEEIVREFVGEVAVAPGSEDQLARWDRRICPGVIGLRNRALAQRIIDRVAQRAFEIGLEVDDPGCRADVIVFITPDSTALATELRDNFRRLVNYYSENNSATLGRDALDDFVETPRTVRWWHVTNSTTRDGYTMGEGTQQVRAHGTRLSRETRQDFSRVIIVVDAQRAQGVNADSLADYIAMVSLAQLDINADTSAYPSILNLFGDAGERPVVMTEWDLAYLHGLYDATRNATSASRQQNEITGEMAEELNEDPAPPAE
ncbi:MAG: hypothetical protein AB7O98_01430 [Hyphomonadaceae bacterium]